MQTFWLSSFLSFPALWLPCRLHVIITLLTQYQHVSCELHHPWWFSILMILTRHAKPGCNRNAWHRQIRLLFTFHGFTCVLMCRWFSELTARSESFSFLFGILVSFPMLILGYSITIRYYSIKMLGIQHLCIYERQAALLNTCWSCRRGKNVESK